METFGIRVKQVVPRTGREAVQLVGAVLGVLAIGWSLVWIAFVIGTMPQSESGFAEGLAIILGGLYFLAGFVLLAVGLVIPQREGEGIRFSSQQRRLLKIGVLAPIAGVLAIPIGATLVPPVPWLVHSVLVAGLVGLLISGPIATIVAIGRKLHADRQSD